MKFSIRSIIQSIPISVGQHDKEGCPYTNFIHKIVDLQRIYKVPPELGHQTLAIRRTKRGGIGKKRMHATVFSIRFDQGERTLGRDK